MQFSLSRRVLGCAYSQSMEKLFGRTDMPPSTIITPSSPNSPLTCLPATTYHALNSCLVRKKASPPPPIPKTSDFGKIVLIYTILTQIFEWRQSTSMLKPTSLMGTFCVVAAEELGTDLQTTPPLASRLLRFIFIINN